MHVFDPQPNRGRILSVFESLRISFPAYRASDRPKALPLRPAPKSEAWRARDSDQSPSSLAVFVFPQIVESYRVLTSHQEGKVIWRGALRGAGVQSSAGSSLSGSMLASFSKGKPKGSQPFPDKAPKKRYVAIL